MNAERFTIYAQPTAEGKWHATVHGSSGAILAVVVNAESKRGAVRGALTQALAQPQFFCGEEVQRPFLFGEGA